MDDDIVISGISGRYPESENVEEFWDKLLNAIPMYSQDDRRWPVDLLDLPKFSGKLKNIEKFDATFFNINENDANQMDPQMRLFHETTYEAIYDAGVNPDSLRNSNTSIYLGSCYNDTAIAKIEDCGTSTPSLDLGPSEVSRSFGFTGATILLDTACASSFSALHEACQAIRMRITERAVVGGIALHLRPNLAQGFRNLRMLSQDGTCKCLDARADGYCRSEAVVSFLIQRRSEAKRVYATLVHSKTNADGFKTEGITFPSRDAQCKLMRECYAEANIDPEEHINYVEAHITGTPVGDPVECAAIIGALRPSGRKSLRFGCLRSNIGHSEGGSALCSITKVSLALQRGEIPPNINFHNPNPSIEALKAGLIIPVIERAPFAENLVAVNSFGFGGVNVHAIFKANERNAIPEDFDLSGNHQLNRLILFNNRTRQGIDYSIDFLQKERSAINRDYLALLNDVNKRQPEQGLRWRGYAVCDPIDLKPIVKAQLENDHKRQVWFVFGGLGSQWPGMGRDLLQYPTFKGTIQRLANVLSKHKVDLVHLLTDASADAFEHSLTNTLVCITSIQIALVDVLEEVGVRPDRIIGHSVGEFGAAYADKVATAEQIIECVYWLGHSNDVAKRPAPELMAAVGLSWEEANARCKQISPDGRLYAACDNTGDSVTVAGDEKLVNQLLSELQADEVFAKPVFCCHMAFHCPLAQISHKAVRDSYAKVLTNPKLRSDRWLITSKTKQELEAEEKPYFDADFAAHNMVASVYFRDALEQVPKDACVVEIGPHALMLPLLRRALGSDSICIPMARKPTDNKSIGSRDQLLSAFGQLYLAGQIPTIENLYPKVQYPVSRQTHSLAHLLKWNHSQDYFVARFPNYFNFLKLTSKFKIDLVDANYKYITGHCIDGRILFPATGYLHLAWSQYARMLKLIDCNQLPVEFRDVQLIRAVILPKNGNVNLHVTLLEHSGDFSISESGSVCCTGRINVIDNDQLRLDSDFIQKLDQQLAEQYPIAKKTVESTVNVAIDQYNRIYLDGKDVYKELRVRGYDYSGPFQGIQLAAADGSSALLKWTGNWVTFVDCMLQVSVLANSNRRLLLPTHIEYLRLDCKHLLQWTEARKKIDPDCLVPVRYDPAANLAQTRGVLVKGLKASPAPRRANVQSATLTHYEYVPYYQTLSEQPNELAEIKAYAADCTDAANAQLKRKDAEQARPRLDEDDKSSVLSWLIEINEPAPIKSNVENKSDENDQTDDREVIELADEIKSEVQITISNEQEKEEDPFLRDMRIRELLSERAEKLDRDSIVRLDFEKLFRHQFATVLENLFTRQLHVLEVNPTGNLIGDSFEELCSSAGISTVFSQARETAASELQPAYVQQVLEFGASFNTLPVSLAKQQFIFFVDWSVGWFGRSAASEPAPRDFDYKTFVASAVDNLQPGGFFLFCVRSKATDVERQLAEKFEVTLNEDQWPNEAQVKSWFAGAGVELVAENKEEVRHLNCLLYRKVDNVTPIEECELIEVSTLNYSWVNQLKSAIRQKKKRVWLLARDHTANGLIGMANCLRREPGGERVRILFDTSASKDTPLDQFLDEQTRRLDLFMNVRQQKQIGALRHIPLPMDEVSPACDAYVDVATKGDLSSLRWYRLKAGWPDAKNGLPVHVFYAALNFKDVMVASGRVPLSAYPSDRDFSSVGMEFSGVCAKTGRRVFGFSNCGAIATQIQLPDDSFCADVPDKWTLEEAATVSVVYVTVYYALCIRGNLNSGERILIHAGSGGIGQAAIAVCLARGCDVYTTVGSERKKQFLLESFPGLKAEQILNSRTDKFEEQILKMTDGEGVHMVLNSLAEEKLRASVRCLSEFGRFIEIGKYDLVQNNPLDMNEFARNRSFAVVCVAHLQHDAVFNSNERARTIMRQIWSLIRQGIKNGEVRPLPASVFDLEQVEDAFRFMANGKHIGKVLIRVRPEGNLKEIAQPNERLARLPRPTIKAIPQTFFSPDLTYIITGGLGGFGLELAGWLVSRGARKLVLSSRSGVKTGYQLFSLRRLRDQDCEVIVSNEPATTIESARALIQKAKQLGSIGGIFNLAMVLKDAILDNQTEDAFEEVCAAKVRSTIYLDELSRQECPDLSHFVCFSSAASGMGNAGQTNYGFANSSMERVCEKRRGEGLPGLAIQWGAVGDVGIVAEQFGNDVNLGGTLPQRIPFCLQVLDQLLCTPYAVCSSIVFSSNKRALGKDKNDLLRAICHVIGIKDPSTLDPSASLVDLGLDSLMAVEIKQALERDYETVLSTQEIRQLSIRDLQEIGARKSIGSGGRKEGALGALAALEEQKHTINVLFNRLPEELFVKLNNVEEKAPVIFVPPIEGDFNLLRLLIEHLNRPVLGLNWNQTVNSMESIKEVATYYADQLIEQLQLPEYDLVGYSFGAVITFEIALQLQAKLGTHAVKKIVLLDGAPEQMRSQTEHMISKNTVVDETSAYAEVLLTFTSIFHEIPNFEEVRNQLQQLNSKEEMTKVIAQLLSDQLGLQVDVKLFEQAIDNYYRKLRMMYFYKPDASYQGTVKLFKASDKFHLFVDYETEHDFGLARVCAENAQIEVIQVAGDHRSFISTNAQEVGVYIDCLLDYIPC